MSNLHSHLLLKLQGTGIAVGQRQRSSDGYELIWLRRHDADRDGNLLVIAKGDTYSIVIPRREIMDEDPTFGTLDELTDHITAHWIPK